MANVKRAVTPRPIKNTYLTPKGLEEASAKLKSLKNEKRAEMAERIQTARDEGGTSENAEYDAALEEQTMVENQIEELEQLLRQAKVIKHAAADNDFVVIGSTVKVEMDGEIDEFTIVGRVEANPAKKRISNESPLGATLLGAKKGEVVEVTTPIVKYKCKILEIK